jgi:acyl-CoA:acyl-CoA alkyltransferase
MRLRPERMPAIVGLAHHLPSSCVSSVEVEQKVIGNKPIPAGLIERLTGVKNRRFIDEGITSSDLAANAAQLALIDAGVDVSDIDLLIFASASHDIAEPATSNLVQAKLGCSKAACIDVKNACNSFLSALDVAAAYIETCRAQTILVATGEVLSPWIDWSINGVDEMKTKLAGLTLGDAGAACIVARSGDNGQGAAHEFYPATSISEGEHWALSTIMAGGTLMVRDVSRAFFECYSGDLSTLALSRLPNLIRSSCDGMGWRIEDVDVVVPHQVSVSIVRKISELVGIPFERCVLTISRFGNTAAASIPLALSSAREEGRLKKGDKILLVGGAAGFSGVVLPIVW